MKKLIPIALQAFWKLLSDPQFKDMVWEIGQIEGRWLAGDLNSDDAWHAVSTRLYDYFFHRN